MLGTLFPIHFSPTFDRLSQHMDQLFEAASSVTAVPSSVSVPTAGWPGLNLWRDGDNIVAEAEVPGFRQEEVEIFATEDKLTIRGQRTRSGPENAIALRVERSVSRFERSVELPIEINPEAVQATLADGVLRVTMPVVEAARPRRILLKNTQTAQSRPALTGSPACTPNK